MLNNLGERCKKILHFLLSAIDYISMHEFAEKTGISRRGLLNVFQCGKRIFIWLHE